MTATTHHRAIDVVDCLGTGGEIVRKVADLSSDGAAAAIVLDLESDERDPARRWVVDGSVAIIEALAARVTNNGPDARRPATILVWLPASLARATASVRAAAEAAVEAVRGIVQSATREESTQSLRVNVVVGRPEEIDDALATVAFLSSSDAGFVAGATFDLRGAR
jgi:hypothetical protein